MPKILYILSAILLVNTAIAQNIKTTCSISVFDDAKYKENFEHFDYVNPDAEKGGTIRIGVEGSFNNLNPHTIKGITPIWLDTTRATLMAKSQDELLSQYCLIAESVEIPEDHSYIIYHINPQAKWEDGTPITAENIIFSLETLKQKGNPIEKMQYQDIKAAEKISELTVKFTFKNSNNRELLLVPGVIPIISESYYNEHELGQTTLSPPPSSGPYKIGRIIPGKLIEYKRNPDYWGKDLPVNKGRHNFDRVIFEYFMNDITAIEAFKAQEYDLRLEHVAKNWFTAYNNIKNVVKINIKNKIPVGMQAYVFNTRKAKFADYRVRKALNYLFDFDWINDHMFFGMYKQGYSYFANTEYAAQGIPQNEELEILKKYQQQLPGELYSQEWKPVKIQNLRENLSYAKQLLEEAGWHIKEGNLVNATGEQMTIEFLSKYPAFERVGNAFAQNLERLGIKVTIRTLGSAEYSKRINDFDFDIIPSLFRSSPVPGSEQIAFWHSSVANIKGSNNIAGVADPIIDNILELLTAAQDKKSVIAAAHALDRVLLWSYYVIPQWYQEGFNVAYWDKFGRPEKTPDYDLGLDTWWIN